MSLLSNSHETQRGVAKHSTKRKGNVKCGVQKVFSPICPSKVIITFASILLLFLVSTGLQAQMPYSYYYKGQKIELQVDKKHVRIIADSNFTKSATTSRLFEQFNIVETQRLVSNTREQTDSKQTLEEVKLKFQSGLSLSEYQNIVDSLKQSGQIKHIFPFFETKGDAEPIGTSDIFYVMLKAEKDTVLLQKIAKQQNVQIIKQVPYMPLWYILSMQNSVFDNSLEATNYFYETGFFEAIDPAFVFTPQLNSNYVNDPLFGAMWGLKNTGQIDALNHAGRKGIDINVCDAWAIPKATGAGVNVAVVDGGVDKNQNDLTPNIHPLSFDAPSGNPSSVLTQLGYHGTHVAGTIAAVRDNNFQLVGVAPEAKIMVVSNDFANDANLPLFSAEMASGISWAYKNGADVINCSWEICLGYSYQPYRSAALESAIDSAMTHGRGGKGTVVVFAAGNDGQGFNMDIIIA